MEGKIKLFQADRAKLQAVNKSCQKKLSLLEENLEATRAVCSNLNEFCTRAENKLKEFQSHKLDLETVQKELKSQCEQLSTDLIETKNKLNLSENNVKKYSNTISEQEKTIANLQAEQANMERHSLELNSQISLIMFIIVNILSFICYFLYVF